MLYGIHLLFLFCVQHIDERLYLVFTWTDTSYAYSLNLLMMTEFSLWVESKVVLLD